MLQQSGFRTVAEAAAARARVLTELDDGLFVPSSKLTLGQYLDRWFATGPTKGWKPNTIRDYRVGIQHIKRYLGDILLQQLTREHIQRLYATLLREGKQPRKAGGRPGPLAPKTVANVHICLHAALTEAVTATPPLRRGNPAVDAYTYSRERAGEELPCWTLEEMRLFLDFVASQRDAGLYAVALGTGMRRGELLGLRRKRDVDLAHARILVRQQWTKAGDEGRKMVALKTGQKAWRTIDLDPFTVAAIDRQVAMVEAERRELGADYQNHGLLFPREDGSPQDPDWVTRKFERLAENCPDVPRIVFHGMRHTHATLLLEDGVSLKVVAERLGDREDTVVKLYGHVTPRGRALAMASVGTWWEQEGPSVRVQPASELSRLRAAIVELEEEVARLKAAGGDAGERTGSELAEVADPRQAP